MSEREHPVDSSTQFWQPWYSGAWMYVCVCLPYMLPTINT